MPKAAKQTIPSPARGRESTYQLIIVSLKEHPAYLLLFSIGLLGGAMGLGTTTLGFFR